MIDTIIFDFDGTVADTNGMVVNSWLHTYDMLGVERPGEEVLFKTFGEPLSISMEKAFPHVPVETSVGHYRDHMNAIFEKEIVPFPGTVELIKELKARGYKVGVATSRVKETTMIGLNKFGIVPYLDAIVTMEDTTKHKPDPEPVLVSLKKLGSAAEEALMIGDSMFDIRCAHNAGVKAVLVSWALAVDEEEKDGPEGPDFYIEKAEDLLTLLEKENA